MDAASRAAKNSPVGCFCAVFSAVAAAVRIHPWSTLQSLCKTETPASRRCWSSWWARVDIASRASKKAPLGLFCQPDCTAGRCCSNPPAFVSFTFAQKKSSRVSLHKSFFHGRGWISRAALLKTARWAVFAPSSAPSPQLFESTLGALCKVSVKQKLQHHEDTGVLGGAKQPKSEPLPSGASLAAISSKVMVFVPSL